MTRIIRATLLLLLLLPFRTAADPVAPERYADLLAADFGEIAAMRDFSGPGDPAGFERIPELVTPFKATLAPFLKGEPPDPAAAEPPEFLAQVKFNDLRRTVNSLAALGYWLARKGRHADSSRLFAHAATLSAFYARVAARPWRAGAPGGGLLPAMISIATRKVTTETAGAALARATPDPAAWQALSSLLLQRERDIPDLVDAIRADLGSTHAMADLLRAADPARGDAAWSALTRGEQTANPFMPPALEQAFQATLARSPEARVVVDLFFADASREIALFESRILPVRGLRHIESLPVIDALDADLTGGRVFRNLFVMMAIPNFRRAFAQRHAQRARADLLHLAAALRAAGPPPETLPAGLAAARDALADGPYGYERAGERFLVYSKARPAASRKRMIDRFRAGEPPEPGLYDPDNGPAFRSDFGFLP